jgi:hypothetical protein
MAYAFGENFKEEFLNLSPIDNMQEKKNIVNQIR